MTFGTDPTFLVRTTDIDTSHEAAETVDTTAMETLVYNVVKQFPNGCTGDEVLMKLRAYRVDTISPRYAALIRKGLVIDTGERRPGLAGRNQRVMKAVRPGDAKPVEKKIIENDYSTGFDDGYSYAVYGIGKWVDKNEGDINRTLAGMSLLSFLSGEPDA